MTIKLDHHHRVTVQKLFRHPLNHNIRWPDVSSLLSRFGEVHQTHRGNWAVTVDGETYSFGSIRSRVLTEVEVVKVRAFLKTVGIDADSACAAQTIEREPDGPESHRVA